MGKVSALSLLSAPAFEDRLHIVDDPSGTPVSYGVTLERIGGVLVPGLCGGRLTTESGVAVSTSDRTAQSTLYFTPYLHNRVAVYDGTRWKLYAFTERSLALSGLTSGKNYDVFLYDTAGTLTLELSAAWTNDTTRNDALTTQDGVLVKSGATSRLYLGTIRTTGTTTTEDSGGGSSSQTGGKRFVWNLYNRVRRFARVIDTTNSWTTASGWRQANNAAGNKVEYVCGVAGAGAVDAGAALHVRTSAGSSQQLGIGIDSTSAPSALYAHAYGMDVTLYARYSGPMLLGYHYVAWLENAQNTSGTNYGDTNPSGQQLQQSGLDLMVEC